MIDSREEAQPEAPPARSGWEPVVVTGGLVIAILATFFSGVLELFLTPLRWGDLTTIWRGDAIGSGHGPLLGLSIVLAAAGNYAIAWFAVSTTGGRRWALGPPWALWTLAGNDWVGLAMILVGSLTFAVYSYRMILQRLPRS
jgi:hypothetical protein